MRAVFGHPFSLLWFSPFATPDHGKAETYQYVVWAQGARRRRRGRPAQPSPAPPHWAQLCQSVCSHCSLHCISHASHGQLVMCFLFFTFYFILLWCHECAIRLLLCCLESSCREKETPFPFFESCLQTLWWICFCSNLLLFPLYRKPPLFLALCFLLFLLKGLVQLYYKKKITWKIQTYFIVHSWWCLAMQIIC